MMLTISQKTKYGLIAMVALAKQFQSSPLQSRCIAETDSIPHNYLEQVLLELKKSGLVKFCNPIENAQNDTPLKFIG